MEIWNWGNYYNSFDVILMFWNWKQYIVAKDWLTQLQHLLTRYMKIQHGYKYFLPNSWIWNNREQTTTSAATAANKKEACTWDFWGFVMSCALFSLMNESVMLTFQVMLIHGRKIKRKFPQLRYTPVTNSNSTLRNVYTYAEFPIEALYSFFFFFQITVFRYLFSI